MAKDQLGVLLTSVLDSNASAGTSEHTGERLSVQPGLSLFIPTEQQVEEFLGPGDANAFRSLAQLQKTASESSISEIAASMFSSNHV